MMRGTVLAIATVLTAGSAPAADLSDQQHTYVKAHPRPDRRVYVEKNPVARDPDLLFTPSDGELTLRPPHTPLLPGSATLPGYYGSTHSYDYQGPYYGGPYVGYWDRLPYACGVYGYC
jgi:hypothetical protein